MRITENGTVIDSDLDYARNNTLEGNKFSGDWFKRHILDNDKNNVIK